jgi:hypothetical protein
MRRVPLIPAALLLLVALGAPPQTLSTNICFPVGEVMVYDLYWGFLHVGTSEVSTEWGERSGRKTIVVTHRTRTNRVVEKIYPVDDTLRTVIDAESFLPLSFEKRMSEGRYRADEITTFDHAQLKARWDKRYGEPNQKEFPIEADTRDLVTMMYFLRCGGFRSGDRRQYRVMTDEKIYDFSLKVGEAEDVKLDRYGKVRSLRIEPEASFNGLFVRKGRLTVWVSDDPRCLCTKIMAEVPVANIRIVLSEVRGPGDDIWVRKPKGGS